jgi:excisionase family DNA binding protein
MPPRNWCTIQEAAAFYDVSPKTIRRMIARGEIYAERIGPRLIRVDAATIRVGKPLASLA